MRLIPLFVMLGSLLFASQAQSAGFFGLFGDSTETVKARDGRITLDVSALDKTSSRHYRYQEDGLAIKFFLVRDGQGTVRAALDACDVCWRAGKGYLLKDGAMVCANCGQKFPLSRIGEVKGGCNPHSFQFLTDNKTAAIETKELMLGAGYFPENLK